MLFQCTWVFQVQNLRISNHGDTKMKTTMQGLVNIIRNQGSRQLFAGLSLNYLKVTNITVLILFLLKISRVLLSCMNKSKVLFVL